MGNFLPLAKYLTTGLESTRRIRQFVFNPVSVLYIECSPLFSKYLDIFFFFVIVHQLLRHKPSACTRIDCVSASCAGFLSLLRGRKYCQLTCKKGHGSCVSCQVCCHCFVNWFAFVLRSMSRDKERQVLIFCF